MDTGKSEGDRPVRDFFSKTVQLSPESTVEALEKKMDEVSRELRHVAALMLVGRGTNPEHMRHFRTEDGDDGIYCFVRRDGYVFKEVFYDDCSAVTFTAEQVRNVIFK